MKDYEIKVKAQAAKIKAMEAKEAKIKASKISTELDIEIKIKQDMVKKMLLKNIY